MIQKQNEENIIPDEEPDVPPEEPSVAEPSRLDVADQERLAAIFADTADGDGLFDHFHDGNESDEDALAAEADSKPTFPEAIDPDDVFGIDAGGVGVLRPDAKAEKAKATDSVPSKKTYDTFEVLSLIHI